MAGIQDSRIDNIKQNIYQIQSKIDQQNTLIQKKNETLEEKQKQVYGQSQEIDDKMKLLDTRNKMLQLSIDRNIYKKKVIYSLLSVILLLLIGILCFYAFFNNAKNGV
jgi:ATP-dependent Zn protease